ncbi:MAG: type II toxin-antitoxin system HicA family toxin [Candidatus Omnitrophica bacterium]|nr:type II toxin-antitoxin system HicA family toxin [Candidatus Omnitrophota bacterium]
MPKIPRDLSGQDLVKALRSFDYKIARQSGSHIRLVSQYKGNEHAITIPDHSSIKIGTLNNILNDIAVYLCISKDSLIEKLF